MWPVGERGPSRHLCLLELADHEIALLRQLERQEGRSRRDEIAQSEREKSRSAYRLTHRRPQRLNRYPHCNTMPVSASRVNAATKRAPMAVAASLPLTVAAQGSGIRECNAR